MGEAVAVEAQAVGSNTAGAVVDGGGAGLVFRRQGECQCLRHSPTISGLRVL